MFLLWEPDLCFKWKLSSNSKDTLVGRLSVRNIKEYKNETGAGIHKNFMCIICEFSFSDDLKYNVWIICSCCDTNGPEIMWNVKTRYKFPNPNNKTQTPSQGRQKTTKQPKTLQVSFLKTIPWIKQKDITEINFPSIPKKLSLF